MANVETHTVTAGRRPPADAAFSALYREHLPAIVRYLRRRLGESAADDAAAEVFVRAFRQDVEDHDGSALPWLYGIAANVILEQRRAERRRLRAIERLSGEQRRDADGGAGRAELDPRLARGLRRLSATDRETLLLVAWGELSYEETAHALGIPVGTVASRIARARRQLDDVLAPKPRGVEPRSVAGDTHA